MSYSDTMTTRRNNPGESLGPFFLRSPSPTLSNTDAPRAGGEGAKPLSSGVANLKAETPKPKQVGGISPTEPLGALLDTDFSDPIQPETKPPAKQQPRAGSPALKQANANHLTSTRRATPVSSGVMHTLAKRHAPAPANQVMFKQPSAPHSQTADSMLTEARQANPPRHSLPTPTQQSTQASPTVNVTLLGHYPDIAALDKAYRENPEIFDKDDNQAEWEAVNNFVLQSEPAQIDKELGTLAPGLQKIVRQRALEANPIYRDYVNHEDRVGQEIAEANAPLTAKDDSGLMQPEARTAAAIIRLRHLIQKYPAPIGAAIVARAISAPGGYRDFYNKNQDKLPDNALVGQVGMSAFSDIIKIISDFPKGKKALAEFREMHAYNNVVVYNDIANTKLGASDATVNYAAAYADKLRREAVDPSIVSKTVSDGITAQFETAAGEVKRLKDTVGAEIEELAAQNQMLHKLAKAREDAGDFTRAQIDLAKKAYLDAHPDLVQKNKELSQRIYADGIKLTIAMKVLKEAADQPNMAQNSVVKALVDETLETCVNDHKTALALKLVSSGDQSTLLATDAKSKLDINMVLKTATKLLPLVLSKIGVDRAGKVIKAGAKTKQAQGDVERAKSDGGAANVSRAVLNIADDALTTIEVLGRFGAERLGRVAALKVGGVAAKTFIGSAAAGLDIANGIDSIVHGKFGEGAASIAGGAGGLMLIAGVGGPIGVAFIAINVVGPAALNKVQEVAKYREETRKFLAAVYNQPGSKEPGFSPKAAEVITECMSGMGEELMPALVQYATQYKKMSIGEMQAYVNQLSPLQLSSLLTHFYWARIAHHSPVELARRIESDPDVPSFQRLKTKEPEPMVAHHHGTGKAKRAV
jgi:hypothetical protein